MLLQIKLIFKQFVFKFLTKKLIIKVCYSFSEITIVQQFNLAAS